MKKLKNIISLFAAWLLLMAILLPSLLQFGHIFEGHEHKFCGDVQVHIHKQELDCDLLLYGSIVYDITSSNLDLTNFQHLQKLTNTNFSSLIYRKLSQSKYLRGPPALNKNSTSITC